MDNDHGLLETQLKPSRWNRSKGIAINLGLLFLVIIICLIIGEITVRIVRPRPNYGLQKGMVVADDYVQYRPASNYSGWYEEIEYKSLLETNSEGWRGKKEYDKTPPPAGRVVLIGDSFTHALMSSEDKTIAGLLRARYSDIGRDVINTGEGGYGPVQELRRAEQTASYKPLLIIWMVWVGNDFTDVVRNDFTVRDGDLVYAQPRVMHFSILERIHMKVLALLYRYSQLWNLASDTIKYNPSLTILDRIPVIRDIRLEAQNRGDELIAIYKKKTFEALQKSWDEKVGEALKHLRATMPGVQIISVIIPTSEQVDQKKWGTVKSLNPKVEENMKFSAQNWLNDWMKKEQVPSLDLTKIIIDGHKVSPAFFFVDAHWNDRGQALAAEEIGKFIDSNIK